MVDGEYVDNESGGSLDRRPLHVVDSQHRKVSCEDDVFLQNFPVFINILPLGSTYAEAAQLFTELNATAEPLRTLHQLHQRYTCFIPHREAGKDYGDPGDPNIPEIRQRHRREPTCLQLPCNVQVCPRHHCMTHPNDGTSKPQTWPRMFNYIEEVRGVCSFLVLEQPYL